MSDEAIAQRIAAAQGLGLTSFDDATLEAPDNIELRQTFQELGLTDD